MNIGKMTSLFKPSTPKQWILTLFLLFLLVAIVSTGVGAVYISPQKIISYIFGYFGGNDSSLIFNEFRFPRILVAMLAGIGLAVSGTLLQGIIRNPLASPDVIGITKGAGLAAVITIVLFPKAPVYILPLSAFAGAIIVTILLYVFAYKKGVKPSTLALVGIALGAICHAGIQYLMIKFPVDINAALAWLSGSVWGRGWSEFWLLLPWIVVLLPVALLLSNKLNVLNLGDDLAQGLGENVEVLRIILLVVAVALAGVSVATVGTIGFVGLVAPHIARSLVGSKHQFLIPASAIIGMLLMLIADGFGRGITPPSEVPAGIFTAIIGAPYFLYLLKTQKNR